MRFTGILVVGALFLLLGSLATDWANKQPYDFYRNPLFSDKSGYYIYLPFAFEYGLDGTNIPDSLQNEVGKGFAVVDGKMITKYPIGVAYLELPFYAPALISNRINQFPDNPYQGEYVHFLVLAPAFYVSLGLYLLFLSLRLLDVKKWMAIAIVAFSFFGTSLYYYTIIEGLMSHSFSYALFAAFTYVMLKGLRHKFMPISLFWLSLIIALILAVRPFNLILLPIYTITILGLNKVPLNNLLAITRKVLPWLIPIVAVFLIPQLIYNKYAYGQLFVDTYTNESFDFLHPNLLGMLFSPNAGLFVYSPAFLLLILVLFYKGYSQPRSAHAFLSISMLVFMYILSSWHSWTFGCGFGIRPFIEWLPLLILPLGLHLNSNKKAWLPMLVISILIIFYNIRMAYQWSGCWFGNEESFSEYFRIFWT